MNLLPRDEKFFQYFQQQVKLICQAAELLVEGAAAGNAHLANAAHQIHVLEEQADNILHETFTRLNSTFITPLDPEDIQSLSSHLDDVIDGIEDSVHRMLDYRIDPMPSTVMELCCIVQSCCLILQRAFDALANGEPFMDHSIAINRLEDRLRIPADEHPAMAHEPPCPGKSCFKDVGKCLVWQANLHS